MSKGIVAAVALGSNLGDRHANMAQGFVALAGLPKTRLIARSAIIETAAQPIERDAGSSAAPGPDGSVAAKREALTGAELGGPYLNAVGVIRTMLEPAALLDALLRIEQSMGRVRDPANRASPRTLDLDLLVYGAVVMETPALTLPHPRLHTRDFVLRPLAQIAPNMVVPVLNRTTSELLKELTMTPAV